MSITTKAVAKVAAVTTGLAMATSLLSLAPIAHAALTGSQVQSILSLLSSFGANSTTIANVKASLTGGTPSTTTTTTTTSSSSCSFTMDLTVGATGSDVTCLQNALIGGGFTIPAGATGYFGSQTKSAVIAWQKSVSVSPTSGYFGPISRSAWNLGGGSSSTVGGNTNGSTTVTGNGLQVSLAPSSPNGSVLIKGQGIGDLGDYVFSNPTSAPVNVTGLTFNRIGVSNDSTLTNVYLYDGGTRVTDSAGISSSQFSYNDASGIFTVPANGTYTVSVRSDISSSATVSGQQVGVSLVSVSSNGTLDSSVSFPINSGYQTISSASMATVDFTNTSAIPSSATTLSAQNDYPLWQDSISVSVNPVKLSSVKFTNLGSVNAADVTNLRLYVDGAQVGTAQSTLNADRSVTFDLTSSPVTLSTSTHVVKVLGNVLSSGANRTIQLSVQRSADAMFVDSQLNQPVTPTINGSNPFAAFSTGVITVQSAAGGVSVSKAASSTQTVAVGASSVKWASFDMLASGENVKVSDLYVYADVTSSATGLNDGKIMVNGVQVGSTKDIVNGVGGSVASSLATDFSLGSSLILPGGQSTIVDVYADAKTTAGANLGNGNSVTVYLSAGSSNAQGVSSLVSVNVPSANTYGNGIIVTDSSLTATKYTGYGNQTVIAGANNAKLGAFTLSTGSTEGMTVNTINITLSSTASSKITNLTLKDEATGNSLGAIVTTPSTSNSYAVNLNVPVSSTKTIDIFGNVLSGAGTTGTIVASVGVGTTGNGDTTNQSASVTAPVSLQTIALGSGTLTVTTGAGDPVSNNVLAGASSVNVGQFTFSSANSSYIVNDLAILVPNSAATSVTNVTVSYKDPSGATKTATRALSVNASMPFATATFTGLGMFVPADDSANLDISVGTPTISSGATSGAAISVKIDAGSSTGIFHASNSAGTTINLVNGSTSVTSGGTFYVRKSLPTFAMVPAGVAVPTTGTPIYKFSITADPAGPVEWSQLTFNVSTSSTSNTATVSNFYLTDESAQSTSLLNGNVQALGATGSQTVAIDLTTNSTKAKYQQIAAGATKTYDLYGTVAGYTTGSTVTISLASDANPAANAAAGSVTGSTIWSDRSATSHTLSTTDWTSGYLLKNFTSNATTYSK